MIYAVKISDEAGVDLRGIYEYIAFELLVPETAANQLERLKKSILGLKSRQETIKVLDKLVQLGYIEYEIEQKTKKLTCRIVDLVLNCNGAGCGSVYAVDKYGFLCIPRNITERLVEKNYKFEESDAWLDLWCHTVMC